MIGLSYGFRSNVNKCATYDFQTEICKAESEKNENTATFGLLLAKIRISLENGWFELLISFLRR